MANKEITEKILSASKKINVAKTFLKNTLVELVRDNGGLIKTLPNSNVTRLVATTVMPAGNDDILSTETIFGIREDNGMLYVCTNTNVSNYEYDNNFSFSSYYYVDDDEIPEMEKCLNDWAYFIELDNETFIEELTLESILYGICDYID